MVRFLYIAVLFVSTLHFHAIEFSNYNIPDNAHKKIMSLQQSQIQVTAFTPKGGWIVTTTTGQHFYQKIPNSCEEKLLSIRDKEQIRDVIFYSDNDGWVILTNTNIYFDDIPLECQNKLEKISAKDNYVYINFTQKNGWIIITQNQVFSKNVSGECIQIIKNFQQGFRNVHRVIFFANGWVVLAKDLYFAKNIPNRCYQQLQKFNRENHLVHNIATTYNNGWSIVSNKSINNIPLHPSRLFEKQSSIWQSMANLNVIGISVAVVVDNKVDWVCNYGLLEKSQPYPVTKNSVFQAASISKTLCAVSVLKLVEQKKLSLNTDIRQCVNSRYLSYRSCLQNGNLAVTVQQLLSHRSGIIGRGTTYPLSTCSNFGSGGGGFAGYLDNKNLPSIDNILLGHSKSNSPRIEFSHYPNQRLSYSGSGYVLLQKIIENITQQDYATWAQENLFQPLNMKNSTFTKDVITKFSTANIASGHDSYGSVIKGKRRFYPESTAAGLYTTVTDLANVIILLNQQGIFDKNNLLNSQDVHAMLQEDLGVFSSGSGNYLSYSHSGSNAGFKTVYYGFPHHKSGIVIFSNSDGASFWINKLVTTIRSIYNW
ncbi:serine hydrolase domain-containing protein [Candidatus Uabimicrobium sp. HlEnr_7]|uniref:serine hydrolase domain-containing protein n=1 Tax=Candidatus Uabimicrobium helgolandensis TaxID=3095367 RepID=UPI003558ACBF